MNTRYNYLNTIHTQLVDDYEEAVREDDEARMTLYNAMGTRGESGAQGARNRAESAREYAEEALREWYATPGGKEWVELGGVPVDL